MVATPARSTRPARPPARRSTARARPAQKRTRAGARYRRDRLYLAGITVLVLVLGLMALGPYADLTAAQQRVATLEDQQADLGESVTALEAEAERLQDPAALEEQAREDLGMARPGEIPYIVVNPDEDEPAPVNAAPAAPAEDEAPSLIDRVTSWARTWGR